MASNLQGVLDQLRDAGLIVDNIEVGRLVRCRVEGDRERRGWYSLHEVASQNGDMLLIGSFGVWHGADNGAQKIEIRRDAFDADQRAALRKRLAEDSKRAEGLRRAEADRAAARAAAAWAKCLPDGESEYLKRKRVGAHGVRFSPSGALVIPMLNSAGQIRGLQIIRSEKSAAAGRRPAKEMWPRGLAMRGTFHLLGGTPTTVGIIAEGYATGATLHEESGGIPVAVAWSANNLGAVAAELRARYPRVRWLIAADNDNLGKCLDKACGQRIALDDSPVDCPACGKPHRYVNAGVTAASTAAVAIGGSFVRPVFADEAYRRARYIERGNKPTDFNDLAAAEGGHVVRAQVEARLLELGWSATARASSSPSGGGGGVGKALRPIGGVDELLERYALIYGMSGACFDRDEHRVVDIADIQRACLRRDIHKAWMEHPDRAIVREAEVDFDPAGTDPNVTCNLWAGWPTRPKAGRCDKLLDLLRHMCSADREPERLYQWVLRWIAYPIQHPGAKMRTTLVLHGPQGTGKNLFFEAVMGIYGQYGRVIDQSSIEDKFNDWASKRLFLIADEVVARSDLYHIKNKLKALITGTWIRINAKNVAARDERNHVNLVFLSNEPMPVVLEEDDRRHAVIWTPDRQLGDVYSAVAEEISAGGIEALHDYLLHLDLGDFHENTKPPYTDAKAELVDLARDSPTRFYYALIHKELGSLPLTPALTSDVYVAYKHYCADIGVKPAPMPKFANALTRKHAVAGERKRYMGVAGIEGPRGVLFLGGDQPPAQSESAWLGDCISAWRNALMDWRGEQLP